MAAYIALFISLVSLILMIVILIRFKKLFSTDAIIDKTKSQMNRVIMDVNNNTNRDIELINEGHIEASIAVEINGAVTNPSIKLYCENVMIQNVQVTDIIPSGSKFMYSSKENEFYIKKVNTVFHERLYRTDKAR